MQNNNNKKKKDCSVNQIDLLKSCFLTSHSALNGGKREKERTGCYYIYSANCNKVSTNWPLFIHSWNSSFIYPFIHWVA